MNKKKSFLTLLGASAALIGTAGSASAAAVAPPFGVSEISNYLMIGTKRGAEGDAVNINSSNELGADQQFLSTSDPNTASVFAGRWSSTTNRTTGSVPASAPVFEGIDWSGNVAVTSPTGRFSMSDIDVYANLGVQCENTPCNQSVSNTRWFPDQQTTPAGNMPGVGVFATDFSALTSELVSARSIIAGLVAETTITGDLENGSSALNLETIDSNNDGIAVIDIQRGGSDFKLNNFDWILNGTDVLGIFRIRGNSNMLLSNSSIALGPGGIGNGSTTVAPNRLGAIFVHYEEPVGNSDQVFNGNNVILNGVGLWDLNPFNGGYNQAVKTEININNGQGCTQFIGGAIVQNDVRWNRCAPTSGSEAIPEPLTIMGVGTALGFGTFFKREFAKKRKKGKTVT